MNFTLTEILLIIITIAISIIAIKITISFNFNEYLKRKDEKMRQQAQNICPHARIIETENGEIGIQSMLISPYGTTNYICQQCQSVSYTNNLERYQYYRENPKQLIKDNKKFQKHLKKMGIS